MYVKNHHPAPLSKKNCVQTAGKIIRSYSKVKLCSISKILSIIYNVKQLIYEFTFRGLI